MEGFIQLRKMTALGNYLQHREQGATSFYLFLPASLLLIQQGELYEQCSQFFSNLILKKIPVIISKASSRLSIPLYNKLNIRHYLGSGQLFLKILVRNQSKYVVKY